ncbi:hypothetical protein SLS62_007269 [Diatrype stigma]|uniref:Cobalamin-independent methionine synthase MetE C-terminal/archaeal domain-containing protein n=1 Tax=Diatrype stigma TaxID=117547 RepID=A0AAN9UWW5_9PEZI
MAYFCSEQFRKGWEEDKDNVGTVEDLLDAYIKLYNDSISKCPADMHTGIHLCRGNFIGGRHFAEGAYDIIAKKLFQNLNVNTFYLEYDTERSGGFEPLKYLPKNKYVVVGVISTKVPQLEDKETMKQRIYKAADFVAEGNGITREEALKQTAVSPQCGFSTHESGYPLTEEDEKSKCKQPLSHYTPHILVYTTSPRGPICWGLQHTTHGIHCKTCLLACLEGISLTQDFHSETCKADCG